LGKIFIALGNLIGYFGYPDQGIGAARTIEFRNRVVAFLKGIMDGSIKVSDPIRFGLLHSLGALINRAIVLGSYNTLPEDADAFNTFMKFAKDTLLLAAGKPELKYLEDAVRSVLGTLRNSAVQNGHTDVVSLIDMILRTPTMEYAAIKKAVEDLYRGVGIVLGGIDDPGRQFWTGYAMSLVQKYGLEEGLKMLKQIWDNILGPELTQTTIGGNGNVVTITFRPDWQAHLQAWYAIFGDDPAGWQQMADVALRGVTYQDILAGNDKAINAIVECFYRGVGIELGGIDDPGRQFWTGYMQQLVKELGFKKAVGELKKIWDNILGGEEIAVTVIYPDGTISVTRNRPDWEAHLNEWFEAGFANNREGWQMMADAARLGATWQHPLISELITW
jgi:hypothetical protein